MLEKEDCYNLRNRSVKRMLWPVDHEQTKRDLKKEQQKIHKEMSEKYNFDFSSGKPLHGRYCWVPVGSESPLSSPCLIPEGESCCSTSGTKRACVESPKQTKTKRTSTEKQQPTNSKQKRRKVYGKPTKKRKTVISRSTYSLRKTSGQQSN